MFTVFDCITDRVIARCSESLAKDFVEKGGECWDYMSTEDYDMGVGTSEYAALNYAS
jgi:hypothetical protein